MARQNQNEQWIMLYMSVVFSYFTMISADEVLKSFNQNLTLPCSGCDHNQDCYSMINGNTANTGSHITQNGSILLLSHNWNVYGSVCCGSDLENLLCHTVCPRYEHCEGCKLILSTNLSSVDDTVRVTKGEGITFDVTFTHQDHNAFTFAVNESILSHPNFRCTSVQDTNVLTKTLRVQYHCVAMELGTYLINSYVTFCNFDYHSPTVFTVIVENMVSSTPVSGQSTSSAGSRMLTNRTVSSGNQSVQMTSSSTMSPSTVLLVIPSTVISTMLPTSTTNVSVTGATEGQDGGSGTTDVVIVVICVFTGLILITAIVIVAVLLLKRNPRFNKEQQLPVTSTMKQCQQSSATENDCPMHMGVTQYGSSRAVSTTGSTSNTGSYIAPSDFSTPWTGSLSSVSESLAHPVTVMSEPTTQLPEDAYTSHQIVYEEDTV